MRLPFARRLAPSGRKTDGPVAALDSVIVLAWEAGASAIRAKARVSFFMGI
jgi:hypothetical protein